MKIVIGLSVLFSHLAFATADSLHFLVMGDWGGLPAPLYTTPAEKDTAIAMGKEASLQNSTFALAVGDNFYETGISTDCHDPRFKHTFEDVFVASSLKGQNFFRVLAGNHDHKGNVTAQIERTNVSDRWFFPQLYYTFTESVDANTTAQFVMIDTVTLAGSSADEFGNDLPGSRYPGPANEAAATTQMEWLNATLAASTADYLFVAGHFPIWSVCEHGPTTSMVKSVKPLFDMYNITAYFAGHDHCEEHIVENGTDYHVVGAANQNQGSHKHKDSVPASEVKFLDIGVFPLSVLTGGFASVTIDGMHGAVVKHFRSSADGKYKTMYTAPPILPRSI